MIVADTDVLVDFLRDFRPVSDRIAIELRAGLATTSISAFELFEGATGSLKRRGAVTFLLDELRILPLDRACAERAAEIRHHLKGEGRTMPMADSLIAGICAVNRAILLTRNIKHFQSIPGLALGNLSLPVNETK